jgi:DNA-directed RNA polymerase specialized sigma24 family protein
MSLHPVQRARSTRHISGEPARNHVSRLDQPGAFQQLVFRAFALRDGYREVFLLKEIRGHSLAEIAAMLGISIDTARAWWQSARREIDHLGDSDRPEPLK